MAKQTIIKGRQHSLQAFIDAGIAQIGTGNEVIVNIPPGGFVKNVSGWVPTAFDGTGTVTASLGDGTTTFINAQTVKATGVLTIAVVNKWYPSGGQLKFSIADQNSNSANGSVFAFVDYVNRFRQDEVQE